MFVAEVATNSDIRAFFWDPDSVLLEYADLDLNLALLSQIIWGQNQRYIAYCEDVVIFTSIFFCLVFT